jgi:hypothetical protein
MGEQSRSPIIKGNIKMITLQDNIKKAFKEVNINLMIKKINKRFPEASAVPNSHFFGDPTTGIWIRMSETGSHNGNQLMEYSRDDSKYQMGTLRVFENFLKRNGYYSEAYDTVTLFAYPI